MLMRFALFFLTLTSVSAENVLKLYGEIEQYMASPYIYAYEDTTSRLTLKDILKPEMQKHFVLNKKSIADFGFTNSAIWMKINVHKMEPKSNWFIVMPVNVNTLDAFEIDGSGKVISYNTGIDYSYNDRVVKYNDLVVPVKAQDDVRTIYLRSKTDINPSRFNILILSDMGLVNYAKMNMKWHYAYLGIMLAMIIYTAFTFLWIREVTYIYYMLYLFMILITYHLGFNFSIAYFFPDQVGIAVIMTYLMGCLGPLFAILFTRSFLDTKSMAPRIDIVLKITASLCIPLFLIWFLDHFIFLKLYYLFLVVVPVLLITTGILLYRRFIYARFYTNAWLIYLFSLISYSFQIFSKLNLLGYHTLELGQVVGASLLSMGLSYKMKEFEIRANRDYLTGIFNRSSMQQFLRKQLELKNRDIKKNRPLSLILIDIDHFKKINDLYGHDRGDLILQEFTKVIQSEIRMQDFFCRWGGEEFVVISPDTTKEQAVTLAERLRSVVETHHFPEINRVTISIGISSHLDNETSRDFFQRADDAVYLAKQHGRNQVVMAKG